MTELCILPERQYISRCCLVRASARVPVAQTRVTRTRSAASALCTNPSQRKLTCEVPQTGPPCASSALPQQVRENAARCACEQHPHLHHSYGTPALLCITKCVHRNISESTPMRSQFGWTSQDPSQLWYTRPAILHTRNAPSRTLTTVPGAPLMDTWQPPRCQPAALTALLAPSPCQLALLQTTCPPAAQPVTPVQRPQLAALSALLGLPACTSQRTRPPSAHAMHGARQPAPAQRLPHASNSSPAAHQTVAAPALQSAPVGTDSMLPTSSSTSTTFLQQAKCSYARCMSQR